MTVRGRFITFEGIDGAGKSTQMAVVAHALRDRELPVVITREPGGTAVGEALREVILHQPMGIGTETLLMFAARAEHLERVIRPALEAGTWVLCDRFTDATYAYQGGGRGLPVAQIDALAGIAHPDLWPDLTLLLDLPVDAGLARASLRNGGDGPDRFESEQRAFFERVRDTYLARARQEPRRFRVIDAARSVDDVSAGVRAALEHLLAGTD